MIQLLLMMSFIASGMFHHKCTFLSIDDVVCSKLEYWSTLEDVDLFYHKLGNGNNYCWAVSHVKSNSCFTWRKLITCLRHINYITWIQFKNTLKWNSLNDNELLFNTGSKCPDTWFTLMLAFWSWLDSFTRWQVSFDMMIACLYFIWLTALVRVPLSTSY